MLRLALFVLASVEVVAFSAGMDCFGPYRTIQGQNNPLIFEVNFNRETIGPAKKWDRARFERLANALQPREGNPVIFSDFFDRYRMATGTDVHLELGTELPDFLEAQGINPREMVFLEQGVQGVLLTHPKLGNSLIKLTRDAINATSSCCPYAEPIAIGSGIEIAHIVPNYLGLERNLNTLSGTYRVVALRQKEDMRRIYLSLAKQALHRAHQIMLPGLVAGEANLHYFDFARVSFIGNGFIVREYYPDSVADDNGAAMRIISQYKIGREKIMSELERVNADFPVLLELVDVLVGQSPSFFVSEALYKSTQHARQRLFVIYDLD